MSALLLLAMSRTSISCLPSSFWIILATASVLPVSLPKNRPTLAIVFSYPYLVLMLNGQIVMPAACADSICCFRIDWISSARLTFCCNASWFRRSSNSASTFNSTRFKPFSRSRLSWLRLLILSWVSRGVGWSLACRGASHLRTDPVLFDQFAVWPYITDENKLADA